jgi:DNA polymerase I-like protein with 3'-5' exonuclease and polymerase domains
MKEHGSDDYPQLVLDVETTMKCPVGNNKASPHWPENRIVMGGLRDLKTGQNFIGPMKHNDGKDPRCLVVGHNVSFDLMHCLHDKVITKDEVAQMHLWDTQLAEYLLTGQQAKFASLDECAGKYGGTLKDDRVSTMFKAGMGADLVPTEMLAEYLEGDLENTAKVFWGQYKQALDNNMLPLLHSQMDARLATTEMMDNGMAVDKAFLERGIDNLTIEISKLKTWLTSYADSVAPGLGLDPLKPQQLAILLFGGTLSEKQKQPDGHYKNGKPKTRTVSVPRNIVGMALTPNTEWLGANGKYSTADDVLEHLLATVPSGPRGERRFIEHIQLYREYEKQLTTYYEGIDALVMPDVCIHHKLNHAVTNTGRLSSSEPNLQNVTDGSKGDIKKAFVSRWGDDGVVMEVDYQQLEMVVLAVLSGDKQLIADIESGADMHTELYKSMFGVAPTKEQRKPFKRCSFALVYGAGAPGIASQSGLTEQQARQFIKVFYARYPNVKQWHEQMVELIDVIRHHDGEKDKETGLPIGRSTYISPVSRRRYTFREYPLDAKIAAWKGKQCGFSPTEIKNYPVQGTATGDIVPMVLGKLFRVLRNNVLLKDKCLLINTVHDSVLFDCHKSVLEIAIPIIEEVMEAAPRYIKEVFNYDFPLKLRVNTSYGPTWFDQTEVSKQYLEAA